MRIYVVLLCWLLGITEAGFSQKQPPLDAAPLYKAQQVLTDVMVHDIFSPPVASRIYVYTHLAAYELLAAAGNTGIYSFAGKLPGWSGVAIGKSDIDPVVASLEAFRVTGRQLVFSEQQFSDSMQVLMDQLIKERKPGKKLDASLVAGKLVGDSILAWAGRDRYKETRSIRRYQLKKAPGTWLPTPPGYMAAVEPNWKQIRCLTMDSAAAFRPLQATDFSTEKESRFYKEALEVYTVCTSLTEEQKAIAAFWDCNPFHITMQGHLNFATKKISPGGHWMQIAGLASSMRKASFQQAARAYTLTAIAVFDAFISCWEEKYHSQLIRPETYINSHINESWRPMLQTPPFPEYPSGHSVVSSAAATVLTQLYGDDFSFVDNTERPYGLPDRRFASFRKASEEAAISRLYGGIHYRPAIENGLVQGRRVGEQVIKKLEPLFR
ncbi:vanadium-dependent haloperoxidase [Flavihumibacter sp. CACIAM 22H1]|uniref:vanadium-dependent haloperoxidase n=1 Tax=Flavihumibacter sp. CACIAM 22H1 TaxID=1812911 RepID=UPI0007A88800|nr:vanadium-dependent haloperoxidase [Flavihumibacter sp. CACIAM 22H1]KYP13340.1 MAG: phosphatidic acid phosphatase [Flavihumibacter sp. CACIAM 22H1]